MPRKRTGKFHGGRAMLNLPGFHSTAAMVAEIHDTGPANPNQKRSDHEVDPLLQFANCDRSISFGLDGFYLYGGDTDREQAMANDLHKLNTMIDLLTQFRDGVILEQKRFKRRQGREE